jgi:hypothetical protein
VAGKVDASKAHLSASGSSLYSDYDFEINSVLKNDPHSPLEPTFHIVLTRPGGKIPVTGGFIQYLNQMFLPPGLDKTYLLFLNQVPAPGTYQPASVGSKGQVFSTLELQPSGTQWRVHRAAYLTRDFPELADAALRSVIITATASCQ